MDWCVAAKLVSCTGCAMNNIHKERALCELVYVMPSKYLKCEIVVVAKGLFWDLMRCLMIMRRARIANEVVRGGQ